MRILLALLFVVSTLLPPYVPVSAGAIEDLELPSQQFLFVEEGFLMKTSSLGEQGSRLAFGEGIMHVVKEGESIEKIAAHYGITAQTIRWANGLIGTNTLKPGQELLILPVDGVIHTVRRGQTLGRIAQLYDISEADIVRQNRIQGGFILAGQQLVIPGGKMIGNTTIASEGSLRFADSLPTKDIRLSINLPNNEGPSIAPIAGALLSQTLLQMPCKDCKFTQKYGPGHYAVDLQEKGGGPIYAAEAGIVIRADMGWNGGYGNVIEIDHGNGLVTLYAHNKIINVRVGDAVSRGQGIAEMGNTGLVHGPTGIHVHFEVRVNGVKKNPALYLE